MFMTQRLSEQAGPVFGHTCWAHWIRSDSFNYPAAEAKMAIGQRIIVHGRVLDQNGARRVPCGSSGRPNAGGALSP